MSDLDGRDGLHATEQEAAENPPEYTQAQLEPWAILRSLADSQKQLAQAFANKATPQNGVGFNGPQARILAVVKIPPFDGAMNTTTRQYKE